MSQLLQLFIWIPLVAFFISLLLPAKKERWISSLAILTTSMHFGAVVAFIVYWLTKGAEILDIKHIVLYKTEAFEFFIDFYFDKVTAVYAFVGSLLITLVSIFSRFYLHRDEGFKRFFNTLLLFYLGYNLIIFSGNFETLFIGWEILGFCSFLLIAFYRDRYLPVKNALKVISVYRLGDVCLILAMWMCHHLFHANITFNQINDSAFIGTALNEHSSLLIFVCVMIVLGAAAKSALFPFSSWLPRAMEGPTTSSAVFYGSLSVHLGAFLLIRTFPLWQDITSIKILIIVVGALSSLIATTIARTQATVKTQIAYSSITQMGLIFIEVALGFHTFALIHFAGNAFLRTYQLLVSPSVLSYEIHNMMFYFKPKKQEATGGFMQKIKNSLYILGVKEWNLDHFLFTYFWSPFKWIGRRMKFMTTRIAVIVLGLILLAGIYSFTDADAVSEDMDPVITYVFAGLGLFLVLSSFAQRAGARKAWLLIVAAQCFITVSVITNEYVRWEEIIIYLGAIVLATIVGYSILTSLKRKGNDIHMNTFHGHVYEHRWSAFIFLLCCLALIGFPFTPTFLGIDLLFTHIHADQPVLITLTALSFIFIELAVLRIYARVYLGPHQRNDHPIAYRSS